LDWVVAGEGAQKEQLLQQLSFEWMDEPKQTTIQIIIQSNRIKMSWSQTGKGRRIIIITRNKQSLGMV
jgi:hypothetical protein